MCGPEDDCHLQSGWAHGLWMFSSYDLDYKSTKQPEQIVKETNPNNKSTVFPPLGNWETNHLKKKITDIFSCQNWEAPIRFPLARLFFEICHWHLGTFGSLVASAAEPALIQRCPMTKRNILATL